MSLGRLCIGVGARAPITLPRAVAFHMLFVLRPTKFDVVGELQRQYLNLEKVNVKHITVTPLWRGVLLEVQGTRFKFLYPPL